MLKDRIISITWYLFIFLSTIVIRTNYLRKMLYFVGIMEKDVFERREKMRAKTQWEYK